MKALVIGATGATGKDLVAQLLEDLAFSEVHVFVRKPMDLQHAKLHVHQIDFEQPESWSNLIKGDVAFSCLGTTLKQAGSKEAQYKVDVTYQLDFAKNASKNGVPSYILVSSVGADSQSSAFYNRIKGELEDEVKKLDFENVSIFQPSILVRENSQRTAENLSLKILKALNFLGFFNKYKPMPTKILASKMIKIAKNPRTGIKTFTLNEIFSM